MLDMMRDSPAVPEKADPAVGWAPKGTGAVQGRGWESDLVGSGVAVVCRSASAQILQLLSWCWQAERGADYARV